MQGAKATSRSPYQGLADRLLCNSVMDERGCWVWLGHCTNDGYGCVNLWSRFHRNTVTRLAHRVAYETFKGAPIPDAHDLDHRPGCPRRCINPDHLTPMPYQAHRRKTGFRFVRANPPGQLRLI